MVHIIMYDDETGEVFHHAHRKDKLVTSGHERFLLHGKISRLEKLLFSTMKEEARKNLKERWKDGIKKANERGRDET